MTKQEMVLEVLKQHSCLTGFEIKGYVYRMFGEQISAQSAAGVLRTPIAQGKVGKDASSGKTVYWLANVMKTVQVR